MEWGLFDQSVTTASRGTYGFFRPTASGVGTKGTYVPIVDRLTSGASGFYIYQSGGDFTGSLGIVDIGIGPHGSEVTILNNVPFAANVDLGGSFFVPLAVPKNVRIGVRCSGNSGAAAIGLTFVTHGVNYGFTSHSRSVTYGANTSTSRGTSVSPSGSVDTKGAWTEIAASVQEDHAAFILVAHAGGAAISGAALAFDVGQGPTGQENIIYPDIVMVAGGGTPASRCQVEPWGLFVPQALKGGQRLAVRVASSFGSPALDVVIIGLSL